MKKSGNSIPNKSSVKGWNKKKQSYKW
jgi:hypothetical protein